MSEKKLYHVTVEYKVLVMAEDESEAEWEAEHGDAEFEASKYANAREITSAKWMSKDDLASIPYGSDDDRTVGDILNGVPAEHEDGAPLVPAPHIPDPNQTSLPFGAEGGQP